MVTATTIGMADGLVQATLLARGPAATRAQGTSRLAVQARSVHVPEPAPPSAAAGVDELAEALRARRPSPRRGSSGGTSPRMLAAERRAQTHVRDTLAKFSRYYRALGATARDGIHGPLDIRVDARYNNASYNATKDRITVGVNPRTGRFYSDSPDIMRHEMGHRMAWYMGIRTFHGIDGVVQESLADTFAAAYDGSWQIGEGLGYIIRDMLHPERLGHPGHLASRIRTSDPHKLAAMPNKAAALIGTTLGPRPTARIYLDATRRHLRSGAKVDDLAVATMRSARDMHGPSSPEYQATVRAWNAVGMIEHLRRTRPGVS